MMIYDESGCSSGVDIVECPRQNNLEEFTKFKKEKLELKGYRINDRKFSDIKPLFSPDYRFTEFSCKDNSIVYSGAEHTGSPKLPNITFLPNLMARDGRVIAGSTFGHQHIQSERGDERRFQEIYEFLGYGAMLLRSVYGTTLRVLRPQEKVVVGTEENMTIINLQQSPLITLDYANPQMNSAHKDVEKKIGSLLFLRFGIDDNEKGSLEVKFNKNYHPFIWGPSFVLNDTLLGEDLFDKIANYRDTFLKAGVNLAFGSNLPLDLQEEFSPSLLELATKQNKTLLDCLEMR